MSQATRALGLLVVLGACLAGGRAQAASVEERFQAARLEFEYKNFSKALDQLRPLLEPTVQLTREADIAAAREMLGLSYFYTGDQVRAREEFIELLYLRPLHRLDPFLIPPPAVSFFDAIRAEPALREKLEQIERERQQALEAERRRKEAEAAVTKVYLERTLTEHWWALNLLPFGIPQFQNGHRTKGIALAVTGGLSLLVNVMSGLVVWGLADGDLRYAHDELDLARGFQITQYASLGVFGALWIYGVADGFYYFEENAVEPFQRVREEVVRPGAPEGEPAALPPPGPGGLVPLAVPGGVGLGWQLRF
jgi:hypothetical protein